MSDPHDDFRDETREESRGPALEAGDDRGANLFDRLGDYLKTERELAHLTQRDVLEHVGLGASRISAVENGSGYPGVENLGRWLDAIGLSPAAFGWRYDLFVQGKPLPPLETETGLEDIVRPLLGKILQETADWLRES
jgi:transcriptional regulator with XRE-family HTH domain